MILIELIWSNKRLLSLFSILVFFLAASIATGEVPDVTPGECLYLLGAPPGEQGTSVEERNGEGGAIPICDPRGGEAGGAVDQFGPDMIQAWCSKAVPYVQSEDYPDTCYTYAWMSHDFRVAPGGTGPVEGSVVIEGFYRGSIHGGEYGPGYVSGSDYDTTADTGALLRVDLIELNEATGVGSVIAEAEIFRREIPEGILELEGFFGRRLDASLRRGATYRARLYLEAWSEYTGGSGPVPANEIGRKVDFGLPGPDMEERFARYDSIRVCLEEPDRGEEILSRLESLEAMAVANSGKLALILSLMDDMSLKECEQIRLLLTPGGRRETTCCDVLEYPEGGSLPSYCGEDEEAEDETFDLCPGAGGIPIVPRSGGRQGHPTPTP